MSNQENGTCVPSTHVPPNKPKADDRTAEWVNAQHAHIEARGLLWQK